MQSISAEPTTADLEMSLREHLLARRAGGAPAGSTTSPYPPPPTNAAPEHPYQASPSADPSSHQSDDTSMRGVIDYALDEAGDMRKGKRELSTSKRAAQNRAAQRAFRQRKEGYIKQLEEKVKDFASMEQGYRSLQNENYQLREYILSLQSRLLESQSDVPPAPAHISLSHSAAPLPSASSDDKDSEQRLRRDLLHHGKARLSDPSEQNSEKRPPPGYVEGAEEAQTAP